jgi:hypothetical protein
MFQPLFALVPPAPVRASLREALTLIPHVRLVPFGEIRAIFALLARIPLVIVTPVRIVDARAHSCAIGGRRLASARIGRKCEWCYEYRRHEQGRKHSPHKVDLLDSLQGKRLATNSLEKTTFGRVGVTLFVDSSGQKESPMTQKRIIGLHEEFTAELAKTAEK